MNQLENKQVLKVREGERSSITYLIQKNEFRFSQIKSKK